MIFSARAYHLIFILPPSVQEQKQAIKRAKVHGDFATKNNIGYGHGSLEAAQIPPSVPSTTAVAEERLPSFHFPVNLSSQPASEAQDKQMRYETLDNLTSSKGLNFNLEKPATHMPPPPSRPPKNRRSPRSPGSPSHRAVAAAPYLAASTHHIKHNHHHNTKNHDRKNNTDNHHSLSSTSPVTPGSGGSATKYQFTGNQDTTNPNINNSQDFTHPSGPRAMISSLYVELQRRVSTLDVTSRMRDGQILKLINAGVATNNAIQSMRVEWKNLVAIMQSAVSEHSGTLKRHTDSILFLENKLIDAENQSRKDKNEILRLSNEVESMSQRTNQMARTLEEHDAARRTFENQVLNHVTAVHQCEQGERNRALAEASRDGNNGAAEAGTDYAGVAQHFLR